MANDDPNNTQTNPDSDQSTDELEEGAVGLEVTDTRVGWVYRLKKSQLVEELDRFGLEHEGSVTLLRRRLVKFLREGRATPRVEATPPSFFADPYSNSTASIPTCTTSYPPTTWIQVPVASVPTMTTTIAYQNTRPTPMYTTTAPTWIPPPTWQPPAPVQPPRTDLLRVHEWHVSFDGRTDPVAFMERLEEVCLRYNLATESLLPVLPELLTGMALAWYRNNQRYWRCWNDFLRAFRAFYLPTDYLIQLEAEISHRHQRRHEKAMDYVTDLQTMIRRHGTMSPQQELYWIHRNLLPEYRLFIHRSSCNTVAQLIAALKEYEDIRQESTSTPEVLAPAPRRSDPFREPRQAPYTSREVPTVMPARREEPRPSSTRYPPQVRQETPQPPPRQPRPEFRPPRTSPIQPIQSEGRRPPQTQAICWRCGQTGHYRQNCRNQPILFCSRCGRQGVLSRDCNCRPSGNENGAPQSGGLNRSR